MFGEWLGVLSKSGEEEKLTVPNKETHRVWHPTVNAST